MTELIDREIAHAKAGKEAYLIAKMNSLIDQPMIEKYYEASQAGVKVDLDCPRDLWPASGNQRAVGKYYGPFYHWPFS